MNDIKLLVEQLERLAAVLDEIIIMPRCAVLVRYNISVLKKQQHEICELQKQVEYLTDKQNGGLVK